MSGATWGGTSHFPWGDVVTSGSPVFGMRSSGLSAPWAPGGDMLPGEVEPRSRHSCRHLWMIVFHHESLPHVDQSVESDPYCDEKWIPFRIRGVEIRLSYGSVVGVTLRVVRQIPILGKRGGWYPHSANWKMIVNASACSSDRRARPHSSDRCFYALPKYSRLSDGAHLCAFLLLRQDLHSVFS